MEKKRNGSIDFFKFLAAFAVILIHVNADNLSEFWQINIRLLGRWAVPFFFIASGYFSAVKIKSDPNSFLLKRLDKLLGIFIISSLLYIPFYIFFIGDFRTLLKFDTLFSGTYYHLWFLGSMLFGFITLWFFFKIGHEVVIAILSPVLIILALLSDSYSHLHNINVDPNLFRFFISIPFLYFGILLGRKDFLQDKKQKNPRSVIIYAVILIISGIVIQYVESFHLLVNVYNPYNHQLVIGTLLFAAGMFMLSKSLNISPNNLFSIYGQRYSLGIYLYHLMLANLFDLFGIYIIVHYLSAIHGLVLFIAPVLILIMTLVLLIILDKKTPRLYSFINGNL